MAEDKVSRDGVFIDTKTGKVVESQPEEGIQLVPAGGTIDNAAAALIEAAKKAADGADQDQTSDDPVDLSAAEEADEKPPVKVPRRA